MIDFERWGAWHRAGGSFRELWYPSQSVEGSMIATRGGLSCGSMSDDEAAEIEAVVLRLKRHDTDKYNALAGYYIHNLTIRSLSKFLKVGETKARQLLSNAESFVEGALCALY